MLIQMQAKDRNGSQNRVYKFCKITLNQEELLNFKPIIYHTAQPFKGITMPFRSSLHLVIWMYL